MDFKKEFFKHLTISTKISNIQDYLPHILDTLEDGADFLPYIQAYGNMQVSYPYYYEISQLPSYCILYTESGAGLLNIHNNKFLLSANTMVMIHCMDTYIVEIKQSSWNYKVFYMAEEHLSNLYQMLLKKHGCFQAFSRESPIPRMIQNLYIQLDKNPQKDFKCVKFIYDIILEFMIEVDRFNDMKNYIPEYLLKIKNNFDSNYHLYFTLEVLEKEWHISRYRICREFSSQFHVSPIRYLNHIRIEKAKDELICSDKKIYEIGQMVGIENTNQFIRLFKKNTGVTPLVYRKQSTDTGIKA